MRSFGVDKDVCATIKKKKDARFPGSNINNKETLGMGTPSHDASECEKNNL